MDNIKDIVNSVISNLSTRSQKGDDKLERVWSSVLEKKELQHTKLVGMRDGTVSVLVDTPAWLYQMNIKKTKILDRLQNEIPDIKNIRYRIGKVT